VTVCPDSAAIIIIITTTTIAPGTILPRLQIPRRERTSLPLRDTIADGIAAAGVTIGPATQLWLKRVDSLLSVLKPHLSPRPESCNNAGRSREKALPI
jgi:hypothetical protein